MDPDSIPPPAGTRFTVDLDDQDTSYEEAAPSIYGGIISDISERAVSSSTALAPSFDTAKSSGGFPAHTKRKRPSAFRQQRDTTTGRSGSAPMPASKPSDLSSATQPMDEMAAIRAENARRIANMTPQEMESERKEAMDSLTPELLQMFLKRASLDDDVETTRRSSTEEDLDPTSPEFLSHLHKKYFPNLPADPQKLAWMRPPSESDPDPLYSPTLTSILPSSIRFDFRGRLLPPRKAREIPSHLGLHHHADSPLSAGYTIPELSHLSRSSFPAQRCMAFQTLGRILYRLGTGAYSKADNDATKKTDEDNTPPATVNETRKEGVRRLATDLERGLWRSIHEGRILETLQDAATGGKNGEGSSHLGTKNYALEALWLWQKGGGERWKAD
ncbi:hypothetical protein ABW20_dc0103823 [Dactylellina cionopaga]|nr:hypothetical protein ABW20_dc0103823 [Dactylellina cionopaga]